MMKAAGAVDLVDDKVDLRYAGIKMRKPATNLCSQTHTHGRLHHLDSPQ